jgi:hypothetical protein
MSRASSYVLLAKQEMIDRYRAECKLSGHTLNLLKIFLRQPCTWPVTKAADHVVIDETGGLHMRVYDRAADETKPAFLQVLAQRV